MLSGKTSNLSNYITLGLFSILILALGYFVPRDNFPVLISIFLGAFLLQFYWFKNDCLNDEKNIIIFAVIPRLILLFAIPLLSDDYFRFVWDGRSIIEGINPFANLPADLIDNVGLKGIFEGLNSKEYYSVYPPVMQLCFATTSFLSQGNLFVNVILLKLIILLADVGIIYYAIKILKLLGKELKFVMLFAVNPLVIMEGVGNLHFECLMMCFALMAVYFLMKWEHNLKWQTFILASLFFALGVMTKFISLLLLPVLIRRVGWGRSISFGLLAGMFCVISILPFLSEDVIYNFSTSLDLYFRKFEFNASFYFIANNIYEEIVGWQEIRFVGPLLAGILVTAILLLSLVKKVSDWERYFMMCLDILTIHLLLSTTVHPWYLINLLAIGIFVRQQYIWAWSFTILLTYSFYPDLQMPTWVLMVEYGTLFVLMIWDWDIIPKARELKQIS